MVAEVREVAKGTLEAGWVQCLLVYAKLQGLVPVYSKHHT